MINMVGPVHIGWKGTTNSKDSEKSLYLCPMYSYQNVSYI